MSSLNRPEPSYRSASTQMMMARREMQRRIKHGRLRPMREPTLLERLLGRG